MMKQRTRERYLDRLEELEMFATEDEVIDFLKALSAEDRDVMYFITTRYNECYRQTFGEKRFLQYFDLTPVKR